MFALIVTDGTMGYCTVEQKDEIGRLRRGETLASCKILGIREDNIFFAGMPDGNTASYRGRRKAGPGDPAIEGYTGLQNLFTYYLRLLRPTRIFLPTGEDLHPDHKVVSEEVLISIFHAAGSIWPELGKSIATPLIYEFAVYCDFRDPPNLKLEADERSFQRKLEGILAFSSQEQILSLIKNIEDGGPFEYIREVIFKLYSADNYRDLF